MSLIKSGVISKGLTKLQKNVDKVRSTDKQSINQARRRELLRANTETTGELAEEFIAPPLSILNGLQGWWAARKKRWIELGVIGVAGRDSESGTKSSPYNIHESGQWKDKDGNVKGKQAKTKFGGKTMPAGITEPGLSPYKKLKKAGLTMRQLKDMGISYEEWVESQESNGKSKTKFNSVVNQYKFRDGEGEVHASSFDPVLVELMYRWFMPTAGGHGLDPFAGGCTQGLIASYLGYDFTGIELRPGQVKVNYEMAERMGVTPNWINGDSLKTEKLVKGQKFDLVFTDPPYFNLEVYSDRKEDGSNIKTYPEFIDWYGRVLEQCARVLNNDRFFILKIGDFRKPNGAYYGFVRDSLNIMHDLGLHLYNEMIQITPIGSLAVRLGSQFRHSRKAGKTHQNVLVFWKGNPLNTPAVFKPININTMPKKKKKRRVVPKRRSS